MIQTSGRMAYKDGYRYILKENWGCQTSIIGLGLRKIPDPNGGRPWVSLNENGWLLLKVGYASDGPSVPILRYFPFYRFKDFMRGPYAHDGIYQLGRAGLLPNVCKTIADQLLYDLCVQDGMSKIRATYVHWAVKNFGWSSYVRQKDKILYAP